MIERSIRGVLYRIGKAKLFSSVTKDPSKQSATGLKGERKHCYACVNTYQYPAVAPDGTKVFVYRDCDINKKGRETYGYFYLKG